MNIKFTLINPARSTGGDRYEAKVEGMEKPLVVYVPQFISRLGGVPAKTCDIDFEPHHE